MQFSVGNQDKFGDVALKIQQRVHLDGPLGPAKPGPGEHRQAEVDRGGVERVDGRIQVDAQVFLGVQRPCLADQDLGEVGVDPPVALSVGVRQIVARDAAAKAHVIPLGLHGPQTGFDIAQTLPISQLCEGHHPQMFAARKCFDLVIATVPTDARIEPAPRNELHQLREHQLACVHRPISFRTSRKSEIIGQRNFKSKQVMFFRNSTINQPLRINQRENVGTLLQLTIC